MISEAEAMRLAGEHLIEGSELKLVTGPPGPMYLVDRPKDVLFFRVDRGEVRVGADEIVAVRKRDGTVMFHRKVGE